MNYLLGKRLKVIVFLLVAISLYIISQPVLLTVVSYFEEKKVLQSMEYLQDKDKKISVNKDYRDPNVKAVAIKDLPLLGVKKSEHELGIGVDPLDPIAPVESVEVKEAKKELKDIKTIKEEYKDNAVIKDAKTKEYKTDDGLTLVEQSLGNRFKEENGKFKEVDFKPKDNNNEIVNASGEFEVKYSKNIEDGITVTSEAGILTFKPLGVNKVKPEIENDRVVYKNVWDGVDLVYEYLGDSIKEFITINKYIENSEFSFEILGGNLSYSKNNDGVINIQVGDKKLYISPLYVLAGVIGWVNEEVSRQEIIEENNIKITLDNNWLKGLKEENFPVIIDPTVTKNISNWSTAYRSYSSDLVTSCTHPSCPVNIGSVQHSGSNWHWRSIVNFDLSEISGSNKQLIGANLYVVQQPYAGSTSSFPIKVTWGACDGFHCVPSLGNPWPESTVTTYGNINITSLLQWMKDTNRLNGKLILWGQEGSNYSYKGLEPSWMELDLLYNTIPSNNATAAYPTNNATITNPNLILKINPASADADVGDVLKYQFVLRNSVGAIVQQSGWTESLSMPVSSGILIDEQTYTWKVDVSDGTYYHNSSTYPYSFKFDTRTGKDTTQAYNEAGPFAVNMATGNAYTANSSHSMNALGGSIGIGLEYNSPVLSREGLSARYWNNTTFYGEPNYTRIEQNVEYNWNDASPIPGIIRNNEFSVSWSGYFIAPTAGTYKFGSDADDTVSVYGNGSLLYSTSTPGLYWSGNVSLTAGQPYPIKIDYKEITGNAKIHFKVQHPSGTQENVKPEYLRTAPVNSTSSNGLPGKYYIDSGNHDFGTNQQRFLMRNEPVIDFEWKDQISPAVGAPHNNFLARFEGYITVPIAGAYTFRTVSDDGIRVSVNNNTNIINNWTTHTATTNTSAPLTLSEGSHKIIVDYFEGTGDATLKLLWNGPITQTGEFVVIENKYLSPQPNVLPLGWKLTQDASGNIPFESLKPQIDGSVVMYTSDGTESKYKLEGGGYKPPVNEDGWLVKNSDNTYTFTDTLGAIYIFDVLDNSGFYKLKESSSPYDDKNPAGLKYEYGNLGGVPKLKRIIDGVDNSRFGTLYYAGEPECPTATGSNIPPEGYLCAFGTTDGRFTKFHYYTGFLSRIEYPGNAFFDYGYQLDGRIQSMRDTSMMDSIQAGLRDPNEGGSMYGFSYDILGRMNNLSFPSNSGASNLQHTFEYFSSSSKQHIVGAPEPQGYSKYLEFDNKYRTTKLCDQMALCTLTQWDSQKDIILSTTGPTGLKSTTIYDGDDRPLESYGPAPAAWFGTDRKPLSQYLTQVPRVETKYDETFTGGSVAFYQVKGPNLFGGPKLHQFGINKNNPSIISFDSATQTFPITKDTSMDGVGLSMSGKIAFPQNGTYTFNSLSTDGVRVFVDDKLIVDAWSNRSSTTFQKTGTFVAEANKVYRVRLDWVTISTTKKLNVTLAGPGITQSNVWSHLKPGFNLPTTNIVYDQQLGNIETKTTYQDPAYGLVAEKVLDPTGLNYKTTATYEPQGTGYFRQLSKKSAGGSETTFSYYGATEQKDNVCTIENDPASQAGFVQSKVEPQPMSQPANLVLNPSFEMVNGTNPSNWISDRWNNNTSTFEYANTGYSGARSVKINVTNYVSGDSKWVPDEVPVSGNAIYTYKDMYKSTRVTELVARYTTAPNTYTWVFLGYVPASTNWSAIEQNFTVPSNATHVSITHLINGVGELWLDDVSITKVPAMNLVLNHSMETSINNLPDKWYSDNWGTNTATFEYANSGIDGSRSLKVTISSFTSGDSKWYPQEFAVTPGATYTFTDSYKSTTSSHVLMRYTTAPNTYDYVWLGELPSSGGSWATYTNTVTIPSNATHATILHLISSVGELWLDNFSFKEAGNSIQPGQKIETIYDSTGRVVASRFNSENWNCTYFDARGRVESKVIASNNGKTGKTVTNNFAYGGNPHRRMVSDGSTLVISEYDFLGNLVKYTDSYGSITTYTYDNLNRLTKKESEVGKEEWVYNDYSQVTTKKFNDVVYATVTYDQYGRVATITYPQAGQLAYLGTTRDTLQRPIKYEWRQSDGTLLSEELTKSQSGLVLGQKFTQGTTIHNQTYTFDKADRLIAADYGDRQYSYSYAEATECSFKNSNRNFNRTSDSLTINGVTSTNKYCYDNADKLTHSTQYGSPTYDSHGNTIKLGNLSFGYDVSDQNISVSEGWRTIEYTRDVLGRVLNTYYNDGGTFLKYNFTSNGSSADILRDSNNNIIEKYVSLPGMTLTVKTSGNEYSIMSSTGNVLAKNTGTLKRYDPFGVSITSNEKFGFGGSELRETEKRFSIEFIQMGARVYVPTLGRFIQVDPVEGGTQNDYVYPNDPINGKDFSGKAWWFVAIAVVVIASSLVVAVDSYSKGDTNGGNDAIIDAVGVVCDLCDLANAVRLAGEGRTGEAILTGLSAVPVVGDLFGKGGKLVKKIGTADKVKATLEAALTTSKTAHIFENVSHNLDNVVQLAGSRNQLLESVIDNLYKKELAPGKFETTVDVFEHTITVRGFVKDDGVIDIGTMFIPNK